ncbi:prolyl oligopeptidase family serine peptidase [Microbulbifer sp. DLAB2-AA]|uniref:prolyl oligopeptidase family serine peptidase n=1 Tax=Microbulbifer sp. DLAB2-AA TaxID=3243394 RepID=UPI00403A4B0F
MRCIFVLISSLLLTMAAGAEEAQRLSAEVLWKIKRVGTPVISPSGKQVVASVTTFDLEQDKGETRLWLLSTDGGIQRPLTAVGLSVSEPVFSPDGKHLAFIGKRSDDDIKQILILPMAAPGEAVRLSEVPTGVSSIKWVGDHLYFISRIWPDKAPEEMAGRVKEEKEKKVSAYVWNALPFSFWDNWIDEQRQAHVFRIPAKGGAVENLTLRTGLKLPNWIQGAESYDVSPDESHLAIVADSKKSGTRPDFDVFLLEPGSPKARNLTLANEAPDFNPKFSPDGRLLAFNRQLISGFYGDTRRLVVHRLRSRLNTVLHEEWDRSTDGMVWAPSGGGLYAAVDDQGTRRIYYLPVGNGDPRVITDSTDFSNLSVASDGTLVGINQSFLYPPRVVSIDARNGGVERLDSFNDDLFANIDLGTYESVTFTGAEGADIQMWVHYPPGFDRNQKYPLMLLLHGGPHNAVTDTFHFRWNVQTFASWGYVTAWFNFHGSSGFGQAFADSINPDWLSRPYTDTIAAADWFKSQSWIDKDQLVAAGGSYGGYLASILLGREHPFNALVIHAPVYNLYSMLAADYSVHGVRFGEYWQRPEIYPSISPHTYAAQFKTPSLVIHGQNDLRVPVGQSFELFRTLQERGVESRLIYYPDENHWVLKPNNSLHWYGQVREWVERFAVPNRGTEASASVTK